MELVPVADIYQICPRPQFDLLLVNTTLFVLYQLTTDPNVTEYQSYDNFLHLPIDFFKSALFNTKSNRMLYYEEVGFEVIRLMEFHLIHPLQLFDEYKNYKTLEHNLRDEYHLCIFRLYRLEAHYCYQNVSSCCYWSRRYRLQEFIRLQCSQNCSEIDSYCSGIWLDFGLGTSMFERLLIGILAIYIVTLSSIVPGISYLFCRLYCNSGLTTRRMIAYITFFPVIIAVATICLPLMIFAGLLHIYCKLCRCKRHSRCSFIERKILYDCSSFYYPRPTYNEVVITIQRNLDYYFGINQFVPQFAQPYLAGLNITRVPNMRGLERINPSRA